MPHPFEISLKARSPLHKAVVEREWAEASEELKQYD